MRRGIRYVAAGVMALLLCMSGLSSRAEGTAPIAENLELQTYSNVSLGARLSAKDPDGDLLRFVVTTAPVKGNLELAEDGAFLYTPGENKRGRDYFGYRAVDSEGNLSQEATVIVRIDKQKKGVSYWDMRGDPDEYAALALSEHDLFTGEQIGGQYSFSPEHTVSRGEFLSMCMLLTGQKVSAHVLTTGYADDAQIPDWMKGYVAAASALGLELGGEENEPRLFEANRPILRSEAEEILDRALSLENVSYLSADGEKSQACMNLQAVGIVGEEAMNDVFLTRLDAARMLSRAISFLDRR